MSVVHCYTINFTYMNFPKVPRMLRENVNVALGSDGGDLTNLFEQIRIAPAGHSPIL